MVKVGDNFIYNAFIGDKAVSKIYYGNDCIWPGTSMTRFLLADGTIKNAWPRGDLTQSDVPADVVSAYIGDLVTVIGTRSFINQNALSSIAIPDSVTSIGAWAFYSCSDLTSVIIPDSVTSIGRNAFECCSGLSSVTIGTGVTSIGEYAFYKCSGLTSVTIPNGVTNIEEGAFSGCTSLLSVSLPDALQVINNNAFSTCTSCAVYDFGNTRTTIPQLKNAGVFEQCRPDMLILVPDSLYDTWIDATNWSDDSVKPHIVKWNDVTRTTYVNGLMSQVYVNGTLSQNSIPNATQATDIKIGGAVTQIGQDAFKYVKTLSSVYIPDGVSAIGGWAFYQNEALVSAYIPDSVSAIGACTYSGCTALTSLRLSESLTSIENFSIEKCYNLSSLNVPDSVTRIGDGAFKGSNHIEVFDFGNTRSTIPQLANTNAFESLNEDYKIVVPDALYENWSLSSTNWNDDSVRPHIVKYNSSRTIVKYTAASSLPNWEGDIVGELAYDSIPNKSHIVEVEIGSHVTSLGNGAFSGCSGLKSVTIPDSVTSIGGCAFSWCSSLTSATIPDSVRSIGREAFDRCSRLMSVTIGNSVTSIKWSAFSRCSGLTSVTIPDSVTSIEGSAFVECTNLAIVDFGNTRTNIPELANVNAFNRLPTNYIIRVPDAKYDEWIAATNWSDDSVKPHIVKWSDYYSLRFTAVDPGATIAFNKIGSPAEAEIMTSLDAKTWQPYEFGTTVMLPNAGDTVYFRAKDENDISFYADSSNRYQFQTSDTDKKIAAFGNIQSLMKADGSRLNISGKSNCYRQLFQGCNGLVTAPILPATALADYCYTSMFRNCTSLTATPKLPAMAVAGWCYASMFAGCKSLTTAPTLPSEALADSCYYQMFWDCTSLTGNTTVVLAQTSAIPNNALYKTFRNTAGQAQLTFTLDMSSFTVIPQLPSPDTMSAFDSASDARLTIKVPASLLTMWRDSSNWSNFADRIIAAT